MAKRAATTTEQKIEEFAEDLGRLLGTAQRKAEGWLGQRTAIAKHLEGIRDTAVSLLGQLGHHPPATPRRGRPAGGTNPAAARKRGRGRPKASDAKPRTMSLEARAKIAAAQRKRWAAQKAGKK